MEDNVKIFVVNSQDDYQKVVAIRSIVFVGEQKVPYSTEFGANELCCTYVLATVNGEPAGTVRIHQFRDFAKLERMAVLREYRKSGLAEDIRQHALDICRRKGITKIYGLCEKELVKHWSEYGYEPIKGAPEMQVDNMTLVPIIVDIENTKNPINFMDNPELLNRQEGEWDAKPKLSLNENSFISNQNLLNKTALLIKRRQAAYRKSE